MDNEENLDNNEINSEDEEEVEEDELDEAHQEVVHLDYDTNEIHIDIIEDKNNEDQNVKEKNKENNNDQQFDQKKMLKIDTDCIDDDLAEVGDENEPVNVQPKKTAPEESYFNMDMASEFNIELKHNNEFINMSHFDEASKAGFAINYDVNDPQTQQFHHFGANGPMSPTTLNLNLNAEIERLNLDGNPYSPNNMNKEFFFRKQTMDRNTIKIIDDELNCIKNNNVVDNNNLVSKDDKKKEFAEKIPERILHPKQIDKMHEKVSDQNLSKKQLDKKINEKFSDQNLHKQFDKSEIIKQSKPEKSQSKRQSIVNIVNESNEINKKKDTTVDSNNIGDFKLNDDEMLQTFNKIKNTQTFRKYILSNHSPNYPKQSLNVIVPEMNKEIKFLKNTKINSTNNINDKPSRNGSTNLINKKPLNNNYINTTNSKTGGASEDLMKKINDENKKLQSNLETYKKSNIDFEEKYQKKCKEYLDLKDKHDTILIEYDDTQTRYNNLNFLYSKISSEKSEKIEILEKLQTDNEMKEQTLNRQNEEIISLKNQIDNMKMELNILRNEHNKKNDKIAEIQQKNFSLEQELSDTKTRTSYELNNLRESKQNLDTLKSSYYEIKNQYELLVMKYQSVSDENFNIKRDLLLYEKEIKHKNEIIEKLRREIIESSKKAYTLDSGSGVNSNLNLNLNLNNILKGYDNYEIKSENYNSNNKQFSFNTAKSITKNSNYEKNLEEFNKYSSDNNQEKDYNTNKELENSNNALPSQKLNIEKDNKVKTIETKLYSMNRERDFIQAELNKLPEHPKKKDQIVKKKELEGKIENYGKELAKLKQELRELNAVNREY